MTWRDLPGGDPVPWLLEVEDPVGRVAYTHLITSVADLPTLVETAFLA